MKALYTLLALVISINAHAYNAGGVGDPTLGQFDAMTKVAVKSAVASYSDAITKGHGLYLDENDYTGAYTVSRYSSLVTASVPTAAQQVQFSCIAARDVATGDTAGFPCVVRGYVDYAIYDATAPILKLNYLCVGTAASIKGKFVSCPSGTSNVIALEQKMSGSGVNLKVLVK